MITTVKHGYIRFGTKPRSVEVVWSGNETSCKASLVRTTQVTYAFHIFDYPKCVLRVRLLPARLLFWCHDGNHSQKMNRNPLRPLAKGIFHTVGPVEPLLDMLMETFPRAEPFVTAFLEAVR